MWSRVDGVPFRVHCRVQKSGDPNIDPQNTIILIIYGPQNGTCWCKPAGCVEDTSGIELISPASELPCMAHTVGGDFYAQDKRILSLEGLCYYGHDLWYVVEHGTSIHACS